ncbi:MAG: histidinol-phosphatase HisJ family protein, partial [Oscillospiraceae bacterium]
MQVDLFDNHTHSCHSPDASPDSVGALCTAAVRAGLTGLAVTDHCDMGPSRVTDWRRRLDASVLELAQAREQFAGRLSVSVGIELGQPLENLPLALEVLRAARFDVVLGSLHNLPGEEDFYFLGKRRDLDCNALIARYFDGLLDMARWGGFDVLAHLTLPYRYFGYDNGIVSIRSFEEPLRAIFHELAIRGKALELNTSGLTRPNHGRTMPELWELKLFRECGGELVTLGSDAHSAERVGGGLSWGLVLLRAAGFEHQAFYKNRT